MRQIRHSTRIRVLAILLALGLILTPALGGTVAGIIARTQCIINTFLLGLDPDGELILRKEVTYPFGEGYLVPEDLRFGFTVCLGPEYAGKTVQTSQGDLTADDSGAIFLTLAPTEAVSIRGIREGTAVTVTEEPAPGFTPESGPAQTVTIGPERSQLRYNNVYAPAPADTSGITVTGTKLLEGRDWQEGDRFTFTLEYRHASAEQDWQTLGTETVTYDPEDPKFDRFDFTELVRSVIFDTAGEYAFRVSEVDDGQGGIIYDKVVSYFDILVGDDDMDGALEIQDVTGYQNAAAWADPESGAFHVEVTICNRYAPDGTADVTIPIRKTVRSFSGEEQSRAGYTFELYDEWGNLIDRSGETSAAGEIAMTLTFGAKDAGQTFRYTLIETGSGETWNGVTYDERIYPIEITVTDNLDGTIRAEITDAPECYFFENLYDPVNTQTDFGGIKELLGRDLRPGEFRFALYAADSSFRITGEPLQVIANEADGSFAFAPIDYDRVGTHRYVVRELPSGKHDGILYDDTLYQITVTVTDEGGILRADPRITDSLGEPADLIFRNVYQPEAVSITLGGSKVLYGMELAPGQFRFELYETDESYQILGEPMAAANGLDGSFSFDRITFTEPGTFYYAVTEDDSAQMEGMRYDERVYGAKVTVWDDGAGSLQADVALTVTGSGEAESITFVNTYTAPTEPTDPTVPTEPTEPSEPTTPTEPSEPSEPTVPTEPTEPSEPSEPTEPTQPSEPTVPPETTEPPDSGDVDKPVKPSNPDQPSTGDQSHVEFYLLLLLLSGAGFAVLAMTGKDKKKTE